MSGTLYVAKKQSNKILLLCLALILSAFTIILGIGSVKANKPIVIMTAEDLDSIRIDMTGNYVLGADIDLDVAPYNEGRGWESIGDYWKDSFSGTFDGKGYTIKGLTIDRSAGDAYNAYATGLFGFVKGSAKISNVKLEDVNIIGKGNTGALVGEIGNGGLIENVTVTGTVTGTGKVGGVVGWLSNAKIKNSHAEVTVTGGGSHSTDVGGLVGHAGGDGALIEGSTSKGSVTSAGRNVGGLAGVATYIKNSSSSVTVTSIHEAENNNAGGLVGSVHPFSGEISNSFATGDVEAIGNNVGGLIGHLSVNGTSVTITNSYAIGTVTGKDRVGGFVGNFAGLGNVLIKESYATGYVYGDNFVGGLIGIQNGNKGALEKSYATGHVDATGDYVGGLIGQASGQTSIKDAYARGDVSGGNHVGSFAGDNQASTIQNGYGTGEVDGTGANVGGFMGTDQRGNNIANFYDQQTTSKSDTTGSTPKSTAEMKTQSTFKGWNFSSVWQIKSSENDGYPMFRPAGSVAPPANVGIFKDINNHWAADTIIEAVDRGFFTGYEDETFKPNNPITRAEFAVIIDRALDLESSGGTSKPLNDINNHWAKEAIEKAQKAGIVNGYEDGSFRPNNRVSRAEIAAMVARALQLEPNASGSTGFNDDSQIPNWAKGYVSIMKEQGIITGREGNTFVPSANTTRAEGAVILLRSVD